MPATLRPYWKNYIGGAFVDGAAGGRLAVIDPATGGRWRRVAEGTGEDIGRAVAAARAAFTDGALDRMAPHERGAMLFRIADELEKAADEIALGRMPRQRQDAGQRPRRGAADPALSALLRRARRQARGAADPARPGLARLHRPRALRRLGSDRAVERAAAGRCALDRLRARHRQHGGAEVAGGFAPEPGPACRGLQARRGAGGRGEHRLRPRPGGGCGARGTSATSTISSSPARSRPENPYSAPQPNGSSPA